MLEAFVFAYLGLTFFTYEAFDWSWQLFLTEVFVIFVGRFIGTIGLVYTIGLCGHKKQVNLNEMIFIWFAGMIRGAIAFGLVLKIDDSYPNRNVIVTTSLALVIFTTLLFGTLMPLISRVLFKNNKEKTLYEMEYEKLEKTMNAEVERKSSVN